MEAYGEIKECSLLDGYAVLVQFFLGLLAVSTLIIKRNVEWPQRPWLVWLFDASKQALASASMHLINVTAATLSTRSADHLAPIYKGKDPCIWYFTCSLVDAVLLLLLMSLLLKAINLVVDRAELEILRHGEYGDPPKWRIWFIQLVLYAILLLVGKGFCLFILYRNFKMLSKLATYLLTPVMFHHRVELVFVMLVFPFINSITHYWVIDQIIKADWYEAWARRVQSGLEFVPPQSDIDGSDNFCIAIDLEK